MKTEEKYIKIFFKCFKAILVEPKKKEENEMKF